MEYCFQRDTDFDIIEYGSTRQLLKAPFDYDILFLDISFHGEEVGVDIALKLRDRGNKAVIVYITSFPNYAIAGYESDAFRYLVKPVTSEQLISVLDSIYKKWSQDKQYISIKSSDKVHLIECSTILYLEAPGVHGAQRRIVVNRDDGEYCSIYSWEPLNTLHDRLPKSDFAHLSRSHIVNLSHVDYHLPKDVVMVDGSHLPMPRRRRDDFLKTLNNFIIARGQKMNPHLI